MDRSIAIGTNNEDREWTTSQELCTGNAFDKLLNIKQEQRNNKPRVAMFAMIHSMWMQKR
eukprot:4733726-Ditylum_brightwellii.AAC.1